ncbi:MAG TPA: YkgJ family cysteine cluster protein, partial [Candidatus Nitrosotenuis sp.]|nr:YkgJ family cysteine cluster protein [Candidatus Nitrosotenuis sp.]
MKFSCVEDCAQCCIERHYYPSKKFGKVGVLILPDEKQKIEDLARKHNLRITILPRIGISYKNNECPEQIIAYQMMGREENGNTCPFLDTESDKKSPHGGFACKIYSDRPLACAAYPVLQTNPIVLDDHCKFCQYHVGADSNLETEKEALIKIQTKMTSSAP